jgi:L-lactate dehydrogenase
LKVSIIGGGGRVGSDAAFALQLTGVVREIVLVDANADMAAGEALDLLHGASIYGGQAFASGGYDQVAGSGCVVITAGLRRQPDESRLDLINRNVGLFRGILDELKKVRLAEGATVLVVSNPVDILTQLTVESGILPEPQVLGLGTVLDSARFRSLIAGHFGVNALDVRALILGEHGDSMVPVWSSATVGGVGIGSIPGWDQDGAAALFEKTKTSGAEVIRQKGGAGRAVGAAIAEVVNSVALDARRVLPVSAMQRGALGIEGVCLSLPTVVGSRGAAAVWEPSVTAEERALLHKSAESLRQTRAQVG